MAALREFLLGMYCEFQFLEPVCARIFEPNTDPTNICSTQQKRRNTQSQIDAWKSVRVKDI